MSLTDEIKQAGARNMVIIKTAATVTFLGAPMYLVWCPPAMNEQQGRWVLTSDVGQATCFDNDIEARDTLAILGLNPIDFVLQTV